MDHNIDQKMGFGEDLCLKDVRAIFYFNTVADVVAFTVLMADMDVLTLSSILHYSYYLPLGQAFLIQ